MEKQIHPTHLPRRKRSARLSLAMMGASAFGLTACTQPAEDEHLTGVASDREPGAVGAPGEVRVGRFPAHGHEALHVAEVLGEQTHAAGLHGRGPFGTAHGQRVAEAPVRRHEHATVREGLAVGPGRRDDAIPDEDQLRGGGRWRCAGGRWRYRGRPVAVRGRTGAISWPAGRWR